jgi:hypothetical protein
MLHLSYTMDFQGSVSVRINTSKIGGVRARMWRLSEPSDSKIWSWVSWDSEPRITMLARAISNLAVSESVIEWEWERAGSLPSRGETPPVVEEEALFEIRKKTGKKKDTVMGPNGAQNQGQLCWWRQAAICWILKINIYSPISPDIH